MKHIRTFESTSDLIEEGIFKRVGEVLGIKGMDKRIEDYIGITDSGFNPSRKANIFISQGLDKGMISTDDASVIGDALSKAKKVGYGLSFWQDGCDLKEMEGSEEEKEIAEYMINRAVNSIHMTSAGEHEFGGQANISALEENLKHLESFNKFKK